MLELLSFLMVKHRSICMKYWCWTLPLEPASLWHSSQSWVISGSRKTLCRNFALEIPTPAVCASLISPKTKWSINILFTYSVFYDLLFDPNNGGNTTQNSQKLFNALSEMLAVEKCGCLHFKLRFIYFPNILQRH